MPTKEIARDEWTSFFDSFSRQHQGWLVSTEVFSQEIGAQTEAKELPLKGISCDPNNNTIAVIIGASADQHITHTITGPTHVRLEQTEDGANIALQIESDDEGTTLLRFHSAVLPEMVDGVVEEETKVRKQTQ